MNWITEKEAKEASEGTREQMLACTVKQWEQLATASIEELIDKSYMIDRFLFKRYCSLCHKFAEDDCLTCPASIDNDCCGDLWGRAHSLWFPFFIKSGSFSKAAKNMYEFLKELK